MGTEREDPTRQRSTRFALRATQRIESAKPGYNGDAWHRYQKRESRNAENRSQVR